MSGVVEPAALWNRSRSCATGYQKCPSGTVATGFVALRGVDAALVGCGHVSGAARMAAAPNALRRSGPNPNLAFGDALTLAGSYWSWKFFRKIERPPR
jgi:hypothetical protein